MHRIRFNRLLIWGPKKVSNLYKEKYWLEPATKIVIRNNIKIKDGAERIVNGFLTEQGALLTSAIIAVVQA